MAQYPEYVLPLGGDAEEVARGDIADHPLGRHPGHCRLVGCHHLRRQEEDNQDAEARSRQGKTGLFVELQRKNIYIPRFTYFSASDGKHLPCTIY